MSRAALAAIPVAVPVIAGPPTLASSLPRFLQWLRFVRERSDNTVQSYAQDLRSFVEFTRAGGVTDPEAVTYQMIEAYQAWLRQARQTKATTANRHLHALRTFFGYLYRERIVSRNPAFDVVPLKVAKRLPKYLTISEQERLLDVLIRDHSAEGQRDLALVATMLFCGLRVSEVVTLRMDQVDLHTGLLRVVGKGDKERELPIVPRLRGILRAYFSDGRPVLVRKVAPGAPDLAWVFVAQYGGQGRGQRWRKAEPLLTRSVYNVIKLKIGPIVGRPALHPHVLRHSFASRLREHGAPIELVSEALGHASIQTTMIYAHLTTAKQRADIARYLEG